MKVLIIQHVAFENSGYFQDIFTSFGADINYLNQFSREKKSIPDYDVLLVMGGPMNIYQEDIYPWLREEKKIIKKAIEEGKIVVGVCLGAQLIADSLGAQIYKNTDREIGWFPVQKTNNRILNFLPDFATVFHWHGETFDLPEKCIPIYRSDLTENQSFIYDNRVIGLQFHLEMTQDGAKALCMNCRDEMAAGKYVMTEGDILNYHENYKHSNYKMLKNLVSWLLQTNPCQDS